ncbi:MAG: energy-coupling factor ABC transporter ATP-binding protein [Candidatus Ancillula trichonymphae]|nr:energy-coupling factor ABC transporter ATP-binding protein [Candidatus Ancillula trichonymphae]
MIELKNVNYRYKSASSSSLECVDLQVERGQIVALIGQNGAGKSTVLSLLARLLPLSGLKRGSEIVIDGKNIRDLSNQELRKTVGIVFQNPSIQAFFPTPLEDIAFALRNFSVPEDEILHRAETALEMVGIHQDSGLLNATLRNFSLGQKQRVVIAGVLALGTSYLCLDEVTSMLDTTGRFEVLESIKALARRGVGVLMVTNNIDDMQIADKVAFLKDRRLYEVVDNGQLLPEKLTEYGYKLTTYYKLVAMSTADPKVRELMNELQTGEYE